MSKLFFVGSGIYQDDTQAVVQRAMDDAAHAGGGTVQLPPGVFTMTNALRMRSGVRLAGSRDTIFRRALSASSPLLDFVGYGQYELTVRDPNLFPVGTGIHIQDDASHGSYTTVATVIDREGDTLFIDRPLSHDYTPGDNATASSLFPMIEAIEVSDCTIEGITLDGNAQESRLLNGCRGGGVFMLRARDVAVSNVEIKNYNGDAITFQGCVDITVKGNHLHHNTGCGLHPGSGSVRYLLEENHVHHNGNFGLFYCLRTMYSRCRNNRIEHNGAAGISIGDRDSHHLIAGNTIRENHGHGLEFRPVVRRGGDYIRIEENSFSQNGGSELWIDGLVQDVHVARNRIAPKAGSGKGIHLGNACERIAFADNIFEGGAAAEMSALQTEYPLLDGGRLPEVELSNLPLNDARHLNVMQLKEWVEPCL